MASGLDAGQLDFRAREILETPHDARGSRHNEREFVRNHIAPRFSIDPAQEHRLNSEVANSNPWATSIDYF